jgi:threonine aldolase
VGDDLYREDPTVNELEQRVAGLLGKETALFVPTGTMANLIALRVLTEPGEEVILEERSHIYEAEVAGLAAVCGLLARPVRGDDNGTLSWEDVRRRIRPNVAHRSQTRLVCLENTHNFAGGTILDQSAVDDLCEHARGAGLKTYLDGARLVNASAAGGRSLDQLAAGFDAVMMDFAKGLGAPAGAAVAGNREQIAKARRVRKMLGGAMHQPGVLAAACIYGLDHILPLIPEDHHKARRLAEGLDEIPGVVVDRERVVTNILMARLDPAVCVDRLREELRRHGVLIGLLEDGRLRLVTHCNVSGEDIETAIEVLASVLSSGGLRA